MSPQRCQMLGPRAGRLMLFSMGAVASALSMYGSQRISLGVV